MANKMLQTTDARKNKLSIVLLLAAALIFPGAAMAKKVTLNMKGADIGAVISTVAEVTGKNFIVDPRVKGKITIISSKPLDNDEVYQVFLAILDVHGFTAVPAGDVIKILPDADAKHSGAPFDGEGEEMVTQVIDIKHISAAQLVPILRPLVPPQGHLAAHTQTNVLIVADRKHNIDRLMKIIERIDVASGSEIEVVQLMHASAAEVVRVLTALQQQERKQEPGSQVPTLVADERTNSILMGGDKNDRLQLKAIIAHLDLPSETVGNTHVVYLHYSKAKDMVAVLTGVGQLEAKNQAAGKPAPAKQGTDFTIQADESANALVISAPPDIYRSVYAVVRKLDVRRAQVLVEAIIAEVSTSKTKELGVQWAAGGDDPGRKPIGVSSFGQNSIVNIAAAASSGVTGGIPIGSGLTMALGSLNRNGGYSYAGIINALAGDGTANLLSTPNIVTMDNEEAEIFVGKEVSIPSGSYTATGTTAVSNPFTTFKSKQVGIRLKVKPQINEGDAIKLEIDQAVDAITAGDAGAANLVTSQRTIKTSVMVNDAQFVVLGGLITDDNNSSVQKIPLLGDIPLLGAFFRYKRDAKDKTNLMVFLRPTIMRDAAVTNAISDNKYSFIRNKQLESREGDHFFKKSEPPLLPTLPEYLKESGYVPPPKKLKDDDKAPNGDAQLVKPEPVPEKEIEKEEPVPAD